MDIITIYGHNYHVWTLVTHGPSMPAKVRAMATAGKADMAPDGKPYHAQHIWTQIKVGWPPVTALCLPAPHSGSEGRRIPIEPLAGNDSRMIAMADDRYTSTQQ